MPEDKRRRKFKILSPLPIAFIITAIVFVLGGSVFVTKEVWSLAGNEIGDFFAGFAGALALVWIIATIFLQKEELELQRKEVARLADEATMQSSALRANAKSSFLDRWEDIVRAFSIDNTRAFLSITRAIGAEQKYAAETTQQLSAKTKKEVSKSEVAKFKTGRDFIACDFVLLQEDNIGFEIIGEFIFPGETPERIERFPVNFHSELPSDEFSQKIQDTRIDLDYLRDLVREGMSHSLAPLMRGYNVQNSVNRASERQYDPDYAFIVEFIIRKLIDEETRPMSAN